MKNLANCTGVEFLKQSNKIRHAVSEWLKNTKILEIRKHQPEGLVSIAGLKGEELEKAKEENEIKWREQSKKNISDMLDVCLEENAEETLKLIGMMCFIDPADIDNYKATELLANFASMLADESVTSFFSSLMKLDVMNISDIAKQ